MARREALVSRRPQSVKKPHVQAARPIFHAGEKNFPERSGNFCKKWFMIVSLHLLKWAIVMIGASRNCQLTS